MKKNIYFLILGSFLFGCEPDFSELYYKEKPFVAFAATEASVAEGNGAVGNTLKLTVTRASPDIAAALTVNFSVTSAKFDGATGDASNTFTLLGDNGGTASSVVIPAGKTTATISFTSKGNTALEKNRLIGVTIQSTSQDLNLGYPGPSSLGKTVTVTIADDDCIPSIGQLLGAFDCFEPNYGTYPCNFSQINCSTIQNDNFWDAGGVKINYTINALTGTVSIPNQTFGTRSVSGTGGTLNLTTGRMVVPYVVKTAAGANEDVNTHTFTRK
ncbi:MAG: hypothetical protein EAZ95_09260 [Bacteroidetes bacterium]|nr:MAG: hypothetical protein EAZ95_09260 [Bacteroidota bacterium]